MRLLLHAVTTADGVWASPMGLRGQPLIVVRHAEVAAYASRLDAPAENFGRADLLAHHDIISGLAAQMDVLPARFPTWLADEEAIRRELDRRRGDLIGALERVRGRVELAVTAVWTAAPDDKPSPEAATPGRKYLLGRQQ